jgi:hypothetical protein
MAEDDTPVRGLGVRLMTEAGLPPPLAVTRLTGGKNNRVYRLDDVSVLKLYHCDPDDPRDRLRAEWRFLTYAHAHGVPNVPRPLARDDTANAGLYTLLPGRKPAAGDVTAAYVDSALAFLLAVNAAPRDPAVLDPGSEACFSLNEHITTIERRVARLGNIDPALPGRAAAAALICDRLRPVWDRVRTVLLDRAERLGVAPDGLLDETELCISPSDFGFHNALADDGRIGFIDFEYAGRDDLAKLTCDFFCQPEVPVPVCHMADFARRLTGGLGLNESHAARCHLLLDAYRVKWACIILNDFLPSGSARRAYADLVGTPERYVRQLARAVAKLNEIHLR